MVASRIIHVLALQNNTQNYKHAGEKYAIHEMKVLIKVLVSERSLTYMQLLYM